MAETELCDNCWTTPQRTTATFNVKLGGTNARSNYGGGARLRLVVAQKYAGPTFLRHLILAAMKSFQIFQWSCTPRFPQRIASCRLLIQLGFSSVMMDGSLLETHCGV